MKTWDVLQVKKVANIRTLKQVIRLIFTMYNMLWCFPWNSFSYWKLSCTHTYRLCTCSMSNSRLNCSIPQTQGWSRAVHTQTYILYWIFFFRSTQLQCFYTHALFFSLYFYSLTEKTGMFLNNSLSVKTF